MLSIWRGIRNKFARAVIRVLSMVANSGGNERAFSVLGRTYADKTRSLLAPERTHKALIVRRDLNEKFPSKKSRKRRDWSFIELREEINKATPSELREIMQREAPDGEEMDDGGDEDGEPHGRTVGDLEKSLDDLAEDGDATGDASADPEVVRVSALPQVRLHFGQTELYPLEKIFDKSLIHRESPWGGRLQAFRINSESDVDKLMAEFEEEAPAQVINID
jgi:hypothetical protein